MKFTALALILSLSTSVFAGEVVLDVLFKPATAAFTSLEPICRNNSRNPEYCTAVGMVSLSVTTYGALTTLALVLLLKKDDVRSLIERAEMNGEISSELKSLVDQMKDEFETKTGVEISEAEVLAQLQAQTI